MVDSISLGSLTVAIVTAFIVFLKSIRRLKCSQKDGIEIERDTNDDNENAKKAVEQNNEFTLELVRTLASSVNNNTKSSHPDHVSISSPRRAHSDDAILMMTRRQPVPVYINTPVSKNNSSSDYAAFSQQQQHHQKEVISQQSYANKVILHPVSKMASTRASLTSLQNITQFHS